MITEEKEKVKEKALNELRQKFRQINSVPAHRQLFLDFKELRRNEIDKDKIFEEVIDGI